MSINSEDLILLEILVSVIINISAFVALTRCAISHFFPLTLLAFVITVTNSLSAWLTVLRVCLGSGVEWAAGLSGVRLVGLVASVVSELAFPKGRRQRQHNHSLSRSSANYMYSRLSIRAHDLSFCLSGL